MPSRVIQNAFRFVASTLFVVAAAKATVIFDSGVTALSSSDPTELGILARNGIISDWSTTKSFPGIVGAAISYHYETYAITNLAFPFLQITVDDLSRTALTFASAYRNVYQPSPALPFNGLNVNYLGDAGGAGNLFAGTDPRAFQVRAPVSSTLVVVVNDVAGTPIALGQNYRIIVEGFYDSNFNDTVPEPGTFAMSAGALALGVGLIAWQQRRRTFQPVRVRKN